MITALDGTQLDITAEQLLFRWDTIDGINIVTFFAKGSIVDIATERENSAQMLASVITRAETVGPHHLDSPDASHRLEKLIDKFSPRNMSKSDIAEWDLLTEDLKDHWNHAAHLTAAVESARLITDAFFAKMNGEPAKSEEELDDSYILRATEIIKAKRLKRGEPEDGRP